MIPFLHILRQRDKERPPPLSLSVERLRDWLARLVSTWGQTGLWPADAWSQIAREFPEIKRPEGESLLWQAIEDMHLAPVLAPLASVLASKIRTERAARDWCMSFLEACMPPRSCAGTEGLLDCLAVGAIDAAGFERTTYMVDDVRSLPADEFSMFAAPARQDPTPLTPGASPYFSDSVRAAVRQALARMRAESRGEPQCDAAVSREMIMLGSVQRAIGAIDVEASLLTRGRAGAFTRTASGRALSSVLPIAHELPSSVAWAIDELSGSSSRLIGLNAATASGSFLTRKLTQEAGGLARMQIRAAAWNATCRLLLFPDAACVSALSGTPTIDDLRLETQIRADMLHGSIASYAIRRLRRVHSDRRTAELTWRWCRAWADLMTCALGNPLSPAIARKPSA